MIGESLGAYKILEPLGAGGMGEVFLAEDTRLGRKAAIKVLPAELAADPDRRDRFEREAKLLASLNHANIAAIYGLEGSGEKSFIAMEFVEGETLADRIDRGAIPLDEALAIARQVADALEAAHDKGIIHRDLKPANIMVTADGTVKVLDFGLAKAYYDDAPAKDASPEISASPTILAATGAGVILGTAAYMSPEQAKGQPLDRRADVWAFGVVLFEILTGRRAFQGADVTEVIAAVIRDVPDLDELPAGSPPALRRLLRRCLEKDPAKRLRDIGDAGLEIDEALAGDEAPAGEAAPSTAGFTWVHAAVVAALVVIAAGAAWFLKPEPEIDRSVTRFLVTLDSSEGRLGVGRPSLAISRDGRQVVYRVGGSIYGRALDSLESRLLVAEAGAVHAISPEGDQILFSTAAGLMTTRIAGGPNQTLVARTSAPINDADWGDDGTVVYADAQGIHLVPGTGGAARQLVAAEDSVQLFTPTFLPGSRAVMYTYFDGARVAVMVVSLDGAITEVLRDGGALRYVDSGHLVYLTNDGLNAIAFDLTTLSSTGPAVLLSESVAMSNQPRVHLAIADNGTLVYFPNTGSEGFDFQLAWVDTDGRVESAFADLHNYSDLRLSPDGRRAAVHLFEGENDIWTVDLVGGRSERITFDPGEDETPVWSPDGASLAYTSNRDGQRIIYLKRADGGAGAPETEIWRGSEHLHINDWAFDRGELIAEIRRGDQDLIAVDIESGDERPLLDSSFDEKLARLSPDGRWLAYVSNETGDDEVWVIRYPELDSRVPVSTDGGTEPVWSGDGQTLYFRSDAAIMAAARLPGDLTEFAVPETMFPDTYIRTQGVAHFHFDVADDGRFLFVADPNAGATARTVVQQFGVVLNWGEELKRLLPGSR